MRHNKITGSHCFRNLTPGQQQGNKFSQHYQILPAPKLKKYPELKEQSKY